MKFGEIRTGPYRADFKGSWGGRGVAMKLEYERVGHAPGGVEEEREATGIRLTVQAPEGMDGDSARAVLVNRSAYNPDHPREQQVVLRREGDTFVGTFGDGVRTWDIGAAGNRWGQELQLYLPGSAEPVQNTLGDPLFFTMNLDAPIPPER